MVLATATSLLNTQVHACQIHATKTLLGMYFEDSVLVTWNQDIGYTFLDTISGLVGYTPLMAMSVQYGHLLTRMEI